MNELPEGWVFNNLGEVCEKITKGGTPTTYGFSFLNEGINFIKVENIENGRVVLNSIRNFISDEAHAFQKKSRLEENDLLFSIAGTIGETCLVKKEYLPANTNQALAILRGYDKILIPNFLVFQLNSTISQLLKSKARGGAMNNISLEDLKQVRLTIPPLPVQHTIVTKIEEIFSELDHGVEQLKTARQQLKVYRQAVLKWAFEGRLTNEGVKDGELPEGWKWVRLSEVSKVSGGLTKNSKREKLELKLPFLRVGNVYFNFLDLKEMHTIGLTINEVKRVKLEKDDLLFVEGNGSIEQVGRVALWNGQIENCVHQNHLIKARLSDLVLPKLALYFFCSKLGRDRIKEQANSTSGLHTLSLGKISKLELPLPPLSEQHLIVSEIERRLSVCDKLEETIEGSLKAAEVLRAGVLKRAFEGRLIH